jgi:hypothetical protein
MWIPEWLWCSRPGRTCRRDACTTKTLKIFRKAAGFGGAIFDIVGYSNHHELRSFPGQQCQGWLLARETVGKRAACGGGAIFRIVWPSRFLVGRPPRANNAKGGSSRECRSERRSRHTVQKGVPDMPIRKASELWCGRPGRTVQARRLHHKTKTLTPLSESHAS